jgi:hypothetical protein
MLTDALYDTAGGPAPPSCCASSWTAAQLRLEGPCDGPGPSVKAGRAARALMPRTWRSEPRRQMALVGAAGAEGAEGAEGAAHENDRRLGAGGGAKRWSPQVHRCAAPSPLRTSPALVQLRPSPAARRGRRPPSDQLGRTPLLPEVDFGHMEVEMISSGLVAAPSKAPVQPPWTLGGAGH